MNPENQDNQSTKMDDTRNKMHPALLFVSVFLVITAMRWQVVDSPPYYDFAFSFWPEANYLAEHDFDWRALSPRLLFFCSANIPALRVFHDGPPDNRRVRNLVVADDYFSARLLSLIHLCMRSSCFCDIDNRPDPPFGRGLCPSCRDCCFSDPSILHTSRYARNGSPSGGVYDLDRGLCRPPQICACCGRRFWRFRHEVDRFDPHDRVGCPARSIVGFGAFPKRKQSRRGTSLLSRRIRPGLSHARRRTLHFEMGRHLFLAN